MTNSGHCWIFFVWVKNFPKWYQFLKSTVFRKKKFKNSSESHFQNWNGTKSNDLLPPIVERPTVTNLSKAAKRDDADFFF